jgi:hypothetical protein
VTILCAYVCVFEDQFGFSDVLCRIPLTDGRTLAPFSNRRPYRAFQALAH